MSASCTCVAGPAVQLPPIPTTPAGVASAADAAAASARALQAQGAAWWNALASAESSVANAATAAAGSIQAALASNGTPEANAAQINGLYGVAGKAASGGTITIDDAETAMVGACALVSPALGAAMATCVGLEAVFVAGLEELFAALGWLAHQGDPPPPPDGPNDPRWIHLDDPRSFGPSILLNPYWDLNGADLIPGTFQQFAVPILARNEEMLLNQRPAVHDVWLLLRYLQNAWNAVHAGPGVTFGLLGAPGVPGFAMQRVYCWPGSGSKSGFQAGCMRRDILRVRGGFVGRDAKTLAPRWDGPTAFDVPGDVKALVVNVGPSLVPPPPPVRYVGTPGAGLGTTPPIRYVGTATAPAPSTNAAWGVASWGVAGDDDDGAGFGDDELEAMREAGEG